MTEHPATLQYSADHEWVQRLDSDSARVGITSVATNSLGELVYIELPAEGQEITAGVSCGEVESTKSVSDLIAPVSGTITAVNTDASDNPTLLNDDPYGTGWLFEVLVSSDGPLLSADEYTAQNAQ